MVRAYQLSGFLLVQLELDLLAYQARCRAQKLAAGSQLPRTRHGWLLAHYRDTIKTRNNAIVQAVENFNRKRGQPVGVNVFNGTKSYAKCLSTVETNGEGEFVYRGANDPVWKRVGR